jgi:hypothetical protein
MPQRRSPGWVAVSFVLPRRTIEGLTILTKGMADRERADRSSEQYGFRRRYPKTKNYFRCKSIELLISGTRVTAVLRQGSRTCAWSSASVCRPHGLAADEALIPVYKFGPRLSRHFVVGFSDNNHFSVQRLAAAGPQPLGAITAGGPHCLGIFQP